MKEEKTQLFLLHFAGGNCYSFQFLTKYLRDEFEIHALELPGRGKRMSEKLIVDFDESVRDYQTQIKKIRNKLPYVIYGHSMGGLLAAYVTKEREKLKDPPLKLIITGSAGPNIGLDKNRYLLPDDEFKYELKKMGGTPEEVLDSEELFDFFSPILRADFELLEKETRYAKINLKSDLVIVMGSHEKHATEIENWKKYAPGKVSLQLMSGNHFFIHDHPEEIAKLIHL